MPGADQTSKSFLARAHGRVDLVLIVMKLGLAIPFANADLLGTWFLVALLVLASGVWVFSTLVYLPHYSHRTNQAQVAFGLLFTWATVSLCIGELDPEANGTIAGHIFWFATPFVAAAGAYLVEIRGRSIRLQEPKSPFQVELKARLLLHHATMLERMDIDSSSIPALVESIYAEGLKEFPHSPLVHLFYAQYLRWFKMSQALELVQLNQAVRKVGRQTSRNA